MFFFSFLHYQRDMHFFSSTFKKQKNSLTSDESNFTCRGNLFPKTKHKLFWARWRGKILSRQRAQNELSCLGKKSSHVFMNTPVGQMGHMVESASKSLFQTAPSSTKSLHATFRSSPFWPFVIIFHNFKVFFAHFCRLIFIILKLFPSKYGFFNSLSNVDKKAKLKICR